MEAVQQATGSVAPWETLGLYRPSVFDSFQLDEIPSEHRNRVEGLIPNVSKAPNRERPWVGGYVERTIDGIPDMSAFGAALSNWPDSVQNILLTGPTGSAKTTCSEAYAAAHRLPFVRVPINGGIDPSSLWGRYVMNSNGQWDWEWSNLALVLMYGGIVMLDEINMAHARIMAALHEAMDDSRQFTVAELASRVVRIHPSAQWFGSMNRGYTGTARLNDAMQRRFNWPIEWEYDNDVEQTLIPSPSLLDYAQAVREMPEVTRDFSTAHMVTFVDTAHMLGGEFAVGRLLAGFEPAERPGMIRAMEMRLPSILSELGIS